MGIISHVFFVLFFKDTATFEISTLSLHDALPISPEVDFASNLCFVSPPTFFMTADAATPSAVTSPLMSAWLVMRSEEHTSELQSQSNLVCRLLLEKKKH